MTTENHPGYNPETRLAPVYIAIWDYKIKGLAFCDLSGTDAEAALAKIERIFTPKEKQVYTKAVQEGYSPLQQLIMVVSAEHPHRTHTLVEVIEGRMEIDFRPRS